MVAHLSANWQGKIELNADEVFPGAMVDELALHAVLLPRVVHATVPAIHAVSPAMALRALLSSNVHQHLGEKEIGMTHFAGLLRRLPCYRMDLADSATRNGKLLRRFLRRLPSLQNSHPANVESAKS
jgi:hypothetical protein